MPVKLNNYGSEIWCDVTSNGANDFSIKCESGRVVKVVTPLHLDDSHKDMEFEIHFFAKKNLKENDVFHVYISKHDIRVGWIIPTISLVSDLHDFSDDEFFLKYAYIAIRESLISLNESLYTYSVPDDVDEVFYSKLFHEETAILVLSKTNLNNIDGFSIDRVFPSMLKHGYVSLSSRNPSDIHHESDAEISRRLNLDLVSTDIKSSSLIGELLNVSFSYEEKPVFKFFFIYQVLELLIDRVYQKEQESIVDELIAAKGDTGKTKEVLDKIQNLTSEKKRISLLINEYSKTSGDLVFLKTLCNELLVDLNRSQESSFEGYFYKIRNFIFHQYRDFPKQSEDKLNRIISEFVKFLPKLLSSFKL